MTTLQDRYLTEDYRQGRRVDLGSTERVRKLNALLHSLPHAICLHRARAYTEVFSQTEGEPAVLRVAKAFAKTLQDLPPVIAPGELIVGAPACRLRAVPVMPETHGGWLANDIDNLATRRWDPFEVSPGQAKEVKELLAHWKGRTLRDLSVKATPPEIMAKVAGTGWGQTGAAMFINGYHFTPPWEELLRDGLYAYEVRAREALAALDYAVPADAGKVHFYQALLLTTAAIRGFAARYAAEAVRLAEAEPDPGRKQELRQIAESAGRVPYHGVRSFREAMQCVCFINALLHLEGTGPVYTPGRLDQFLYPYYKADIEKGELTPGEAQELIECLFIKITETLWLNDTLTAWGAPGYKQSQTVSIGGVDALGKDASNELSYVVLEAAKAVRTIQPDIVLLCHPRETPYSLKMKAAELTMLGLGLPKYVSTETIKIQLMEIGYSLEEARTGWIQGCTEPYGPGCKQYGHSATSHLNLPMALEMVLFNGRKRTPGQSGSGESLGVETGDCRLFTSFDEFMTALKAQIARQIVDGHIASSFVEAVRIQHFPVPLQSLLTDGCIEKGLTANAGGARLNVGPGISFTGGLATVADSLAAIKKLVFEEKKITMAELIAALDANFEGYETIRQLLINRAPKFGNDDDYVDDLARDIFHFANCEVKKQLAPLGNHNMPTDCIATSHMSGGAKVWATPDGRLKGAPLSHHISPANQRDLNGPSANINSVTKLGLEEQYGNIHNMYLVNVKTETDLHRMVDLIDLFHARGGHHIQINCQDKEVFIDAQKHPDRYPGLMVRVAGYVAYFVDLPRELQDEIISRTSLEV